VTPEEIKALVDTASDCAAKKAAAMNGNSEKVWRDRILLFITMATFIGGVSTAIFVTRGEHKEDLATKADKEKVDSHVGETAHREQKVINEKQAEWNKGEEEAISVLGTGLKRMELLMVEQMVASGQLDRSTIRKILKKVPE
jgi:hypothetical protein